MERHHKSAFNLSRFAALRKGNVRVLFEILNFLQQKEGEKENFLTIW